MGSSIKLGRILGIPFGINYSWFLIFSLVAYSMEVSLGELYPGWSSPERWATSLVSSALLFASVVAHELSHSLVAIRKGIPVRGITLFIFGGVAQISREATRPSTELLMAVVGPASSILLGLLFLGLHLAVEPFSVHLAAMTQWLFLVNVALGLFNMIPGFPLDGGRVFRAVVWAISGNYSVATRLATICGQVVAVVFVAIGAFIFMGEEYLQGIWLAFIGWFLWQAASASFRHFRQRQRLEGYVSRDLMSTDCPDVSPDVLLREVVQAGLLRDDRQCLVVAEDGLVEGLVNRQAVKRGRRGSWETVRVSQVMTPIERVKAVGPEDDAHSVLEAMDEGESGLVLVADGGEVIGVVLRDSLVRLMGSRSRPGG